MSRCSGFFQGMELKIGASLILKPVSLRDGFMMRTHHGCLPLLDPGENFNKYGSTLPPHHGETAATHFFCPRYVNFFKYPFTLPPCREADTKARYFWILKNVYLIMDPYLLCSDAVLCKHSWMAYVIPPYLNTPTWPHPYFPPNFTDPIPISP